MSKFNFNDDRVFIIKELLKLNTPITTIARQIGCQYGTLVTFLKREGIEYNKNPGRRGFPHIERLKNYSSSEEYMNSVISPKNSILLRLLEKERGYRKCEICQNEFWNGKPIPLEIHHIDGDHSNKSPDNIQMVCPNCHTQTDNYKSKNMKK